MAGREMAGQQQITGMTNALVARSAIQQMQTRAGGDPVADAAATAAPAMYGTFIAKNGLVGDLLGSDGAKSLEKDVQKRLMGANIIPGSQQYTDAHDRMIATELAKMGIADPTWMKKMIQVGGVMGSFNAADAVQKARTTTSTDAKGMQSTRTTQPAYTGDNAAQLFGGTPEANQALAPYGYTDL
jgi:hypothetical protein